MRLAKLTTTLALALATWVTQPAIAAPDNNALLEKLTARVEHLETRNAELEKEVKAFQDEQDRITQGLESERISQYEPELTSRLKAVENDTLEMKKAASVAEKFDGIEVGAALTTIAQRAAGLPQDTANGSSHLNYRADVTVDMPLDAIGDIEHKLFVHGRVGQGEGLNGAFGNLGYFSAPNAVAFRASGANADDSVLILGEAWYQADIPLPLGGFQPYSRETMQLTFGKMDIFGFFDQNDAAGDESIQFLNSVFVHNPLLDAGGEVAVDANGFQPGFIASYFNERNQAEAWRLSLGVFGAGDEGASYQRSLSTPLFMVQAEKQLKLFGGLTGNYRGYAWMRRQAPEVDSVSTARHTGIGVSIDQRVGDGINLFGRFGRLEQGELAFNRAISLGAEFNGGYWGRGGDAIGVGGSWLKTSATYRSLGGSGDINGDGSADFAFTPAGAEQVAEIYYRYRISPQFEVSPDVQWIGHAAGNPDAKDVTVIGLRANFAY
jgi:hypothetical protein